MKTKTWIEKITDESNSWLNAMKQEDEHNYFDAINLYLDDAYENLKSISIIDVALDCVCAANCANKMKYFEISRKLYHHACMLYEKNYKIKLHSSPSESIWSLIQAYDITLLNGDYENSQRFEKMYLSLTQRLNPFYGETDAIAILRTHKTNISASFYYSSIPTPKKLIEKIDDFVNLSSLEFRISSFDANTSFEVSN